jgi:hypothetical protein
MGLEEEEEVEVGLECVWRNCCSPFGGSAGEKEEVAVVDVESWLLFLSFVSIQPRRNEERGG